MDRSMGRKSRTVWMDDQSSSSSCELPNLTSSLQGDKAAAAGAAAGGRNGILKKPKSGRKPDTKLVAKSILEDGHNDEDSDASSSNRHCRSGGSDQSGDDDCITEDMFDKESVRKKLDCLGRMVGSNSREPVEILSEVVRVIKELEGGGGNRSAPPPKSRR